MGLQQGVKNFLRKRKHKDGIGGGEMPKDAVGEGCNGRGHLLLHP